RWGFLGCGGESSRRHGVAVRLGSRRVPVAVQVLVAERAVFVPWHRLVPRIGLSCLCAIRRKAKARSPHTRPQGHAPPPSGSTRGADPAAEETLVPNLALQL